MTFDVIRDQHKWVIDARRDEGGAFKTFAEAQKALREAQDEDAKNDGEDVE